MKIKAKKTNSASENAIRSSYFVIELCKLSSSSVESKNSDLQGLITGYLHIPNKQMSLRYKFWPITACKESSVR